MCQEIFLQIKIIVFVILESFTNHKMSNEMISNSGVCQNCFIKFNEFDEHQTIAIKIQQELLLLYETSLAMGDMDMKLNELNIKREPEIDYGIVEVMLEHDEGQSDGSDVYSHMKSPKQFNSLKMSSRSFDRSEKRSYKRKKNLDEGLTVVEVDGQKIYQCDICKKLCKDRYKLKTHREIHTTERTICCNECGAMFKTLTCLYSHKKIHRERIYNQCDHCEMRYIQKTQLRKHMDAIHLKKKDHVCSICGECLMCGFQCLVITANYSFTGKCYSRDTTLSKHMFVHKEEKDVVCTVCGFRTHTKPKMERHMVRDS